MVSELNLRSAVIKDKPETEEEIKSKELVKPYCQTEDWLFGLEEEKSFENKTDSKSKEIDKDLENLKIQLDDIYLKEPVS